MKCLENDAERPGLCDVAIVCVNVAWQVVQKLTNEPTAQPMFYPAISQRPMLVAVFIDAVKTLFVLIHISAPLRSREYLILFGSP